MRRGAERASLYLEALEAEPSPALQQLSVDGAMVPLLHGEWAEVPGHRNHRGAGVGRERPRPLSYFSRDGPPELCHTPPDGKGSRVCAVMKWPSSTCPDAVRILVPRCRTPGFGAGTIGELHRLKHGEPEEVLGSLRGLCRELEQRESGVDDEVKAVKGSLTYLEKRRGQIRYAEFHAEGYPLAGGGGERQQAGGGSPAAQGCTGPERTWTPFGAAYGGLQ